MPRRITPTQKRKYRELRGEGFNRAEAARQAGVSYSWAKAYDNNLPNDSGRAWKEARQETELPGPKPYDQLSSEAKAAHDDFEYFGRRYFGRLYDPWQLDAAYKLIEWMKSPERMYVVVNVFPGAGKTSLVHDLACWVTVRDRALRALMGSRTEPNARRMMRKIRRSLERTTPAKAKADLAVRELAFDAEACLPWDFGTFRPEAQETWTRDEFVVAQMGGTLIEEKEPTWSCYGADSGVVSNRFDLMLSDDPDDKKTLRTLDAVTKQRETWDEEVETRLEPGGTLVVVQQRLSRRDLSAYLLAKRIPVLDEEDDEILDVLETSGLDDRPRMYMHVSYPAHDESKCRGRETHKDPEPWPDGCLLSPTRLPWRDIRLTKATKPRTFRISYQQQDTDPDDVLVPDVWLTGGTDPLDGTMAPGCWTDRELCQKLPDGVKPLVSVATVDPSPSRMWACQWWVAGELVAGDGEDPMPRDYLMDLERKAMPANELLDWNAEDGRFVGLMEDWQARSHEIGYPIRYWIVETNAAQKFLLQYDHVRRWISKWKVNIVPHNTSPKKADDDFGPWTIREHYRYGRVQLPGSQRTGSQARIKTLKLTSELTSWPEGETDDQVMANWFYFFHKPALVASATRKVVRLRQDRPDWWAA